MSQPVLRHIQHQGHESAPCHALSRVSQRPCSVSQGAECCITSLTVLYRDTTVARHPRFCIATPLGQAMLAHAGWSCRGLYRGTTTPCRGRGLAVSWPLQLCPTALCHDTIHCIMTQMGSSPSNCLLSRFFLFFSHHFFSSYWKTTKKIFFSHLPVEPNKFIKIYFILFIYLFIALHTIKPKKNSFNTNFFPYELFTKNTFHTIHNTQSHITQQSSECTRNV